MGWDGIYSKDRNYPIFNVGDEVYTENGSWSGIRPRIPYTVLKCFKKPGMIESCKIIMLELQTDIGYKSSYATYHFKKTERQLREDKIKEILDEK